MGYQLMQLAMHHGTGLSAKAFKILMRMSHHALDDTSKAGRPARLYFAGWQPLALALGHDPDAPDVTSKQIKAMQESVRRALVELTQERMIETADDTKAGFGRRQTYRLTFDVAPPIQRGSSPTDSEGQHATDSEGQQPHRSGGPCPTDSEGPRKEEEPGQDSRSGNHGPGRDHLTSAKQAARSAVEESRASGAAS